jgi:DNA mismatch repair protein MutS
MQEELNECEIARQAVCYLINFINEHNPDLIKNINNPVFIKDGIYLELENHSLRQLNIIDDKQYTGKLSSMASFLNNCVTSMGKRLFYHNITNPIVCPAKLQAEYNITEYGLQEIDIAHGLNTELLNIKDIEKLNRKIILKTISPFEFYLFYKTLKDFHTISLQVHENDTLKNFLLYKLPDAANIVENISDIATEIETNIDHQAMATRQQHEFPFITQTPNLYYFQPTVDTRLNAKLQLFETSQTIITTVIQKLNQIIRKHESKDSEFVKLHVTEKTPPTLQLTKRRAQILKKNLGDKNLEIPLDNSSESFYNLKVADIKFVSNKNIEIVSSVQINTLCNTLFTVKEEICAINKRVFSEMLERFGQYYREFSLFSKYCAYLDIFQNNVRLAHNNNFCKPTVVESPTSFIDATDLRHPLIEKLQTNELYVANTIQIGMPDINQNGILLYGTNAVGKTCLIKSLGIAVIMAQAGLFVPCSAFEFAPYRNIFTRILGNDNMFKGLSTFAVEMSELRTILNKADQNSLILGDELCSGTESDSAMSIFIAGLLDMHAKNCNFIFATHFHDIVNYDEIKNMENLKLYHMTVVYDPEQQKLIYDRKLKSGAGDSMYGLEVCKSLDLPLAFLERAYEIRRKYNKKYDGILSKKTSKYNSKKIIDQCEICKGRSAEHVHHLQYQQNANSHGFINTFDKNHLANLVAICKECHDSIHKENVEMQVVKTTDGFEFKKIKKLKIKK